MRWVVFSFIFTPFLNLRSLRRDISDFLQPIVSATQLMISARGQLFHAVAPPPIGQAAPPPPRARPVGSPILQPPAFIVVRTRRQIAQQVAAVRDRALTRHRQSRLRFTSRESLSSEGAARVFTVHLCSIQELIETGWAARGIRAPFGSGPSSGASLPPGDPP